MGQGPTRYGKRYANRHATGAPSICPLCLEPFPQRMENQVYCGRKGCRERDARIRGETPYRDLVELGRSEARVKLAVDGKLHSKSKVSEEHKRRGPVGKLCETNDRAAAVLAKRGGER